jgi:hypothetical protein
MSDVNTPSAAVEEASFRTLHARAEQITAPTAHVAPRTTCERMMATAAAAASTDPATMKAPPRAFTRRVDLVAKANETVSPTATIQPVPIRSRLVTLTFSRIDLDASIGCAADISSGGSVSTGDGSDRDHSRDDSHCANNEQQRALMGSPIARAPSQLADRVS